MSSIVTIDGSKFWLARRLKDTVVLENIERREIVKLHWNDVVDLYVAGRLSADLRQPPHAAEGER
jgi:hypothetical protein